jgi:hypothetical protein
MANDTCELVQLVGACPDCGHRRLRAVFDGHQTNFRCRLCGACWRGEPGTVERVDPLGCGRCHFRPLCLATPGYDPVRAA